MEYKISKLKDLTTYITRGITPKYTENKENGIVILNQKCIRNYKINMTEARMHNIKVKKVSNEKMLKKYDILINSTGVGTAGRVAQNTRSGSEMTVDSHITIVRPDKSKIDPLYLGYAIKEQQSIIEKMAEGSTGQTEINRNRLGEEILIKYPTNVNIQNIIANILYNIDKKIEINSQISNKLFKISERLYKRWFVDFEFPNKKGCPYKSSGEKMEDSELGEIPKGWRVGFFNDGKLTKIVKTGIEKFDGFKKYVATADVDGTNINNYTNVSYDSRPSRANMQPIANSVWFAKMQDSAKNILVDNYMEDVLQQYIFSTGFMGVECLNNSLYYIWNYINSKDFVMMKNNLSTGTLMAGVNNKTISGCKYLIPSEEILNIYNEKMKKINAKIYNNVNENKILIKLREILLTKLLNGEINIDNIKL